MLRINSCGDARFRKRLDQYSVAEAVDPDLYVLTLGPARDRPYDVTSETQPGLLEDLLGYTPECRLQSLSDCAHQAPSRPDAPSPPRSAWMSLANLTSESSSGS